jgi:hypothetical protein
MAAQMTKSSRIRQLTVVSAVTLGVIIILLNLVHAYFSLRWHGVAIPPGMDLWAERYWREVPFPYLGQLKIAIASLLCVGVPLLIRTLHISLTGGRQPAKPPARRLKVVEERRERNEPELSPSLRVCSGR